MCEVLKRSFIIILAVLIVLSTTACTEPADGGSATGSSDITVSDPQIGFIREDDYEPSTKIDTTQKWTSLDVDTSYYMFLSFDITAAKNNDGQSLLNLNITFDALNVMDGTVEDVNTGMIESLVFTDAVTGNVGKTTTVSFKIPAISTEPKRIEMIVKVSPIDVGESHIVISYGYDPEGEYKILGSDGYTKNLKINEVQIGDTTLSVVEPGFLSWKHVKNAEYYMIFENNQPLKDFMGEDIVISAEGYAVGGEIVFSLTGQIFGFHNLRIRAFSSNKNILPSNYSNIVSYTWS